MKKLALLLVFICLITAKVYSQNMQDVVNLKNGNVIVGVITYNLINQYVKIQVENMGLLTIKYEDIESIKKKENPASTNYNDNNLTHSYMVNKPSEFSKEKLVTIFLGPSFPMGDYGASDLTTAKAGFAKTGFCGGFELANKFSDILYGVGTLSLSVNSMDDAALNKLMQEELNSYDVSASISTGSYLTAAIMYGFRIETPISPGILFYGQGELGVLYSKMPDWNITATTSTYDYYSGGYSTSSTSATASSDVSIGFAYSIGAGIIINNTFNVGFRYLVGDTKYSLKMNGADIADMDLTTSLFQVIVGLQL